MEKQLFDRVVRFVQEQVDLEQPSFITPLVHSERLKLYAFYKQATVGKCSGTRPSFFDLHGRYKYDAWNELSDMNRTTAASLYVETVVDYVMSLPKTFTEEELASMCDRDRALIPHFVSRIDDLKADCASMWPERFAHLRKPDQLEMSEEFYEKEEIESYNVKRNTTTFGSPLVMAEDMGITIPSNLAGLITGHAVHSETESDESFNEDDPLNVKEPRSLDAISFESANRRSPIDHESKYTVYDSDKVYDAIHTLQAKVDSIDEKIHYIKSLIVTYSRLCLASVGIISIASTSCLFYFFSSIFVKRISES